MKHTLRLPSVFAAPPLPAMENGPASTRPYFTIFLLLSPVIWPVGIAMGLLYLCYPRWRSAGATMLTLGLISGALSALVYLSIR